MVFDLAAQAVFLRTLTAAGQCTTQNLQRPAPGWQQQQRSIDRVATKPRGERRRSHRENEQEPS